MNQINPNSSINPVPLQAIKFKNLNQSKINEPSSSYTKINHFNPESSSNSVPLKAIKILKPQTITTSSYTKMNHFNPKSSINPVALQATNCNC